MGETESGREGEGEWEMKEKNIVSGYQPVTRPSRLISNLKNYF